MAKGPPYGDSADEQARKRREQASEALRKTSHDWGLWSSPDDPGRRAHQEKRREQGKAPGKGCLEAAGKLAAGTVTAVIACMWLRRR